MASAGGITDVLVVGGGPVGLALALELGLRGDRVTLVERADARGPQPRAKTLNMRSLEHFRRWGVADAVRSASTLPADVPTDILFQTRLFGKHIATLPNIYFRGNVRADDPRFCEPSEWVPQHVVEGILKQKIDALDNVTLHYGTEMRSFAADEQGVTAALCTSSGDERTLRAPYLVGADGARSLVRETIGSNMSGRHAFAANLNMVMRIPELNANPPSPRGIMHWLINEDSPAVMGPIGDLWYIAKQLPEGKGGMSADEIRDFVTATMGREVAFELLTQDPWYAHELIADKYREGRVFLAGDACHLHPPFGGYGMNMGIGDAVDLGWKLDAVLQGWADPALLDSYEFERRRVHQWTIEEAMVNYKLLSKQLIRPGLEDETPAGDAIRAALAEQVLEQKRREFHTIGLVLGYHYGGSPVIAGDDGMAAPSAEHYDPVALCGALAPHYWLAPGVSLYDRLGQGFTLLDRGGDGRGAEAFLEAASSLGVPLDVVRIAGTDAERLYGSTLTLVRPDQHIAWHGDDTDERDATEILLIVTARSGTED